MEDNIVNDNKKMGFFKRLKTAIFNLEEYGFLLTDGLGKAIKYFLLLSFIIVVCIGLSSVYSLSKVINTGKNYIYNELPDFNFENNNLDFKETVNAFDHGYFVRLIIDTSLDASINRSKIEDYTTKQISKDEVGIVLLKDRLITVLNGDQLLEISYEKLNEQGLYDDIKNKESLVNLINEIDLKIIYVIYLLGYIIPMYIIFILSSIIDIITIYIFVYLACMICKVFIKSNSMIALSLYALTFGLILNGINSCMYLIFNYEIVYMNIIYLLITYVYAIAAVLMIKYDLIKLNEELQKIKDVQKDVQKEAELDLLKGNDHKEKEESNEEDEKTEENDLKDKKTEENNLEEENKEVKEEPENKDPDGSEI